MAPSLLLALPAELRLRIYELALTHPNAIVVKESNLRHELAAETSAFLSQAQTLTRTCRQICKECGVLFYTRNDFALHLSAFLVNVILVRHLIPKFDKAEDNTSSALDIILPSPLRQFDANSVPDNVAVKQSRAILYRLSDNLRRFQHQHSNISITMHLPVRLTGLAGEARSDIEIDFKQFEASLDGAVVQLHEMLDNHGALGHLRIYINELLRWKRGRS